MKFLVYTAMFKRPMISELFCLNWQRIANDNPEHTFTFFAAVSEMHSETICRKYDWLSFFVDNIPVGNKFNKGLEWAVKADEYDCIIIAGSDDLASSDIIKAATKYKFAKRYDYFGVQSVYILSPARTEAVEFTYPVKKLCGSYRFITKRALEQSMYQQRVIVERDFLSYREGQAYYMSVHKAEQFASVKYATIVSPPEVRLWHPEQNSSLDMYSEFVLASEGFYPHAMRADCMVSAIKSDVNINLYDYVSSGSPKVEFAKTLSFVSDTERSIIRLLGAKF